MQNWEYRVEVFRNSFDEHDRMALLNGWGALGWELVNISPKSDTSSYVYVYLKRLASK